MSDVMLFGVLRMPYEMAMGDDIARHQYWQRGQQAADEITRLRNELHIAQEWSARVIAGREQDIAEITSLRAEVERLNKSRNKWGQKYNKLLEKHKVTLSQLKAAVWSDSEECKLLTAEVEKLRAALQPFACQCAVEAGPQCLFRNDGRCCNYTARATLEDRHD